ncbi:MAG TPA: hypothetical protein VNA28_02455 [Solirubrobacteraceae bacterium]|nr:hypothetical protein [Solirubrobacteraceae bacterium]
MTSDHDTTGITALDELGHRFQDATAQSRRRRQRRRWPIAALGALALAATPAIAAVLDSPDSVEDQLPQVAAAVDYDDPAATGRALTREGFRVHWVLITDAAADADSPTRSRHVAAPPSGTKILSVLNQKGGNEVSPDTRDLQIEIAPAGSKILQSHR